MRVAAVHDWLTGMRGGEYVLEGILEIFPRADLFTLVHVPGSVSNAISSRIKETSWLQRVPGAQKKYRHFLPLMPRAIQSLDFSEYDLILSSSHCVAKGIRKPKHALHVSYVHAPMRYMWDRFDEYFGKGLAPIWTRAAARLVRKRLQDWDRDFSQKDNVDELIANSHFISKQIEKAYGRTSTVVHPFADISRFKTPHQPQDYYLMVSAFAPYKRVDLAVEVFNSLKLPLKIVGSGQDEGKLRQMAGPTIEFLGFLENTQIDELYSKCKAFIFPGVEDFGITPLEAMAAGAPVIAFNQGGASETVTAETGVFFDEQTPEALRAAVEKVEQGEVHPDPEQRRKRANQFTKNRFQREYIEVLRRAWGEAGKELSILEKEFTVQELKPEFDPKSKPNLQAYSTTENPHKSY